MTKRVLPRRTPHNLFLHHLRDATKGIWSDTLAAWCFTVTPGRGHRVPQHAAPELVPDV